MNPRRFSIFSFAIFVLFPIEYGHAQGVGLWRKPKNALVRTLRASVKNGAASTANISTSSFTPANTSLLVASVAGVSMDYAPGTAVSGGGLTWTRRVFIANDSTTYPDWQSFAEIWTAPVTVGASMTVTLSVGGDRVDGKLLEIYEYRNYNTATPTGATATGTRDNQNGAYTITLSGTPASSSVVHAVAAINNWLQPNTFATGTGWTQLSSDQSTGAETQTHVQARTNSTSTSVLWNEVHAGNAADGQSAAAVALEIRN